MLKKEVAEKIIEKGLSFGADFAEVYVEEARDSVLSFKNKEVETASSGIEYGVGIRFIFGGQVLYAHSSDDREESLLKLTTNLCVGREETSFSPLSITRREVQNIHGILKHPRSIALKEKLPFLQKADSVARSLGAEIQQVAASAIDATSLIQIFNSEGLDVSDERIRSRFTLNVTSARGEERISAHEAPGAGRGFEFFESLDIDSIARRVGERALRMLDAGYIEGAKMPVILGNGFGGVIFHEACGHPLETESIRKEASPFCGKLGKQIAHEKVTAIDDGTIPNSWGSLNIDDEGMPVQKTTLIENGILKNYLSDRVGAKEVGVPRTGSARRESFKYAPVSRMRNTYIAAGTDKVEDMIASVEDGLYALKMGGGSVNPATGEFNFSVEEGYRVRKGKLAEAVRGATLIGKGHEVLPKISMVADDFELTAGMCGASSGMVPVTVGQPTLKVDNILVGGR